MKGSICLHTLLLLVGMQEMGAGRVCPQRGERKRAYVINMKRGSVQNGGARRGLWSGRVKFRKREDLSRGGRGPECAVNAVNAASAANNGNPANAANDANASNPSNRANRANPANCINVAIFGSSGSIGANALDVIRECNRVERRFNVEALYVNKSVTKLYEQAREFLPKYVCIHDESKYEELKMLLRKIKGYNPEILVGDDGMKQMCSSNTLDRIIIGIDSFHGLYSTIYAIKSNKIIGLANKESIVSAGFFLKKLLTSHTKSCIIPVDSEHSAIFQCLDNNKVLKTKCLQDSFSKVNQIKKLILSSSGGPFQNASLDELKKVTAEDALKHPKWKMGPKITIDSATMMNKGLEVIEAHFLFDVDYNHIEILVHKECILHSCVEFIDKSVVSQMYLPDMKLPILYALTWPNRIATELPSLNLASTSPLTFYSPSLDHFPCIKLAYQAGRQGNFYPTVLNAANEVANKLFLSNKIGYFDIAAIISDVLESFTPQEVSNNCEDLMHQIGGIHKWAVRRAEEVYRVRSSAAQ
ncbi:1-deoxy-D-xylulose 5-phosphate reductoisomerase, putative [Plasmodium vivax]|uniref:1-deoxy-D-xylulose 5-phosphate reductoisomerase, apicoplastic n=2 Tax=Plasmodium vivax TaxID=5855 RepID=A5K384_PLAVS|nr:1-deoxy-D-xylulose 5-phosphate reductoisomerase, putative [Plasmodium vivax]EDL45988.1 1-deoxy-D-xylulose 5-phosphate reductoisomerase, putative [Plasmodium vivax]KMZ85070.1 1-deoxy-D-xylulose 5-phosphate reductoisomerase [Plasmodium vivax Brazil I]CAI7722208.1 1-deoxy-D-xylulose 5-phosphate reductoisomerase, putative [Plasmodium vivax]|eukprot:XP_001615715.1 1-deoxy-D-xylulose 5-phosphate reductoisomerase [Plasmodium vivax Sal-1]